MTASRSAMVRMVLMAVPALAGSPPVAVAEDSRKPGTVFRDCAECPEMVVIPAGSFMMGAAPGEEKREGLGRRLRNLAQPQHRVSVAAFAAGKYEVTRGEYAAFVTATGRGAGDGCWIWTGRRIAEDPDKSWRDPGYAQDDRHPVACVSWQDARAYTDWLSGTTGKRYRLLSEAEWEYAARGGTKTARFWGEDGDQACAFANGADQTAKSEVPGAAGWNVAGCTDGYAYTAPVGSFRANSFGLYDTLGNVLEWVEDVWHDNYRDAPADGSAWTDGEAKDSSRVRVVRGGSWDYVPSDLRSANRGRRKPSTVAAIKGSGLLSPLIRTVVFAALPIPLGLAKGRRRLSPHEPRRIAQKRVDRSRLRAPFCNGTRSYVTRKGSVSSTRRSPLRSIIGTTAESTHAASCSGQPLFDAMSPSSG